MILTKITLKAFLWFWSLSNAVLPILPVYYQGKPYLELSW